MPDTESNYSFFELAFQKFETTEKKTEKSKHIFSECPLPSPGTTPVIEQGQVSSSNFQR